MSHVAAAVVVPLADKIPTDNNVVAGWVGFAVFMFLVVALGLLLWSFTHRLKKARTNFGVVKQRWTIPTAGTPEGDAALAEAVMGGPAPSGRSAAQASGHSSGRPSTEPSHGASSTGRHRGAPETPTS